MEPLSVQGTIDSLSAVGQYVMAASEEAGLTKSEAYKLRLAVDEIVTNIMVHGYAESGKTGTVEMQTEVKDGMLRLSVEDTGPAFDPFSLAPPDDLEKPLEERAIGGLALLDRLGERISYS